MNQSEIKNKLYSLVASVPFTHQPSDKQIWFLSKLMSEKLTSEEIEIEFDDMEFMSRKNVSELIDILLKK